MVLIEANSAVVKFSDVYTQEELDQLIQIAAANKGNYKNSKTINEEEIFGHTSYRKSHSISAKEFHDHKKILRKKILNEFEMICNELKVPRFKFDAFQMEMTTHNDGDYYLWHKDNDDNTPNVRVLTFVYYFYVEPKMYTGGELVLYPKGMPPVVIVPTNNLVVVFDSNMLHEVKAVSCPDHKFEHGRFAINGFIEVKRPVVEATSGVSD